MPFIPHTEQELRDMLAAIGVDTVEALFDEIPATLRLPALQGVPPGEPEWRVAQLMHERAKADATPVCFLGAGAYDHHVPAAVWQVATRGEFYSAYTPYQPEASQGTLQLLYEFQTMVASLMGLDCANASLYDGASALAEAVLMAVRATRGKVQGPRIWLPRSLSPRYRRTVHSLVAAQGIVIEEPDFCPAEGRLTVELLEQCGPPPLALALPQPNYFGVLEDVDAIADWAAAHGVTLIGVVNPLSLSVLKPPGEWGEAGAAIACGEGQSLGIPLAAGGPYLGLLACRQALLRQMPGRIVGRTEDRDGREGFVLTLQAREQHIRRAKATSNICTNQGLLATAATLHMSIMGPAGLAAVARESHAALGALRAELTQQPGVEPLFEGPVFNEQTLRVPRPAGELLEALLEHGILGGRDLAPEYPELGDALLVCTTEKRGSADIARYGRALGAVLQGAPGTLAGTTAGA